MKRKNKQDIMNLIDALRQPISTLQAVAVWTDDKGLAALVNTALVTIKELDFNQFFANEALATEFRKSLEAAVRGSKK